MEKRIQAPGRAYLHKFPIYGKSAASGQNRGGAAQIASSLPSEPVPEPPFPTPPVPTRL